MERRQTENADGPPVLASARRTAECPAAEPEQSQSERLFVRMSTERWMRYGSVLGIGLFPRHVSLRRGHCRLAASRVKDALRAPLRGQGCGPVLTQPSAR